MKLGYICNTGVGIEPTHRVFIKSISLALSYDYMKNILPVGGHG
jgi:hypothetical protein